MSGCKNGWQESRGRANFARVKSINDISLSSNELDAIRQAVALLKKMFPVVGIRLFGSKARGDSGPESDIDLLVLTEKQLPWRERDHMTDSLYQIQMQHDVVISLLVVPLQEWTSGLVSALPIHDIIEEEGIAA